MGNFFSFKVPFLQGRSETKKVTHYLLYKYTVLYKLLISISEQKIQTYLDK